MAESTKATERQDATVRTERSSGSPAGFSPGSVLAQRWEIEHALGEGGMGQVFRATDLNDNSPCAVKVMHTHLADREEGLKRFHREASVSLGLKHENIVDVLAVNFTDDRQPFIVMQFIQGKSLDQLLEERRYLNMDEFLNIFRQICRGLSFAHDNNVVHRDIKPSNIMIVSEDGREKVKIVDFGIARICRTTGEICPNEALQIEQSLSNLAHSIDAESLQKLTQPGKIFGSPLYMSPEQFRGQEADCRSEVYALGCMMFEALTGVPPLSGDTATETVMKKLTDAPPSLNSVVPGLTFPVELEEIISRALVPEPDERYQSVQELYEAICAL